MRLFFVFEFVFAQTFPRPKSDHTNRDGEQKLNLIIIIKAEYSEALFSLFQDGPTAGLRPGPDAAPPATANRVQPLGPYRPGARPLRGEQKLNIEPLNNYMELDEKTMKFT